MLLAWVLSCDSHEQRDDGTTDIYGEGIDTVYVDRFPATVEITLLARVWLMEDETSEIELQVFGPDTTPLGTLRHGVEPDPEPNHRPGYLVTQTEELEVGFPAEAEGTYSIDPAVFKDTDGRHYMYFGGIWGGQLQRWASGAYKPQDVYPPKDQPAISAKVARVGDDMVSLAESPRDVVVLDEQAKPLSSGDNGRRFFEASWLHKYNGTYYFSYSTGDTHFIVYATGTSPYGPFTYRGKILEPVLGWTNHHSIVEFQGKWYLFYHDAQLSGGQTHLRNIKVTELKYRPDGSIETVDAYRE